MATKHVTPTHIRQAAACDDFDHVAAIIQEAAGIFDGGVAAMFFSAVSAYDWQHATLAEREDMVREYVALEAHYE